MPGPHELLGTYLTDHLAGAAAAVELVAKARSKADGTPLAAFLAGLAGAIESDRDALAALIDRLGVQKSPLKQLGASAAEKISRLRLHERVTGSDELSRLMELESLALGIEGKLRLWRSLKAVVDHHPALAATDLDSLADRATHQLGELEVHRLEAAAAALGRD
jgi:hypothetical protein